MPTHQQDRRAHELFLLDTYAERKASERSPRSLRVLLPRLIAMARGSSKPDG